MIDTSGGGEEKMNTETHSCGCQAAPAQLWIKALEILWKKMYATYLTHAAGRTHTLLQEN